MNNREKCPRGGVLARFYRGVGVLNSFFARGWGIRPSKKLRGDFAQGGGGGGWSDLELTDTLHVGR